MSITPRHPILTAVADIDAALKGVASVNPTFMASDEKARALGELVALESRLVELRLRILADAEDLAEATAAADPAGWLAHATRTRLEHARADQHLARALDRDFPLLHHAMRTGAASPDQARVVVRALESLPAEVDAETVTRAEAVLVGHCADFEPRALARLGRRILHVVAPEIAEEAEARALARLEDHAHRRTRLTMRRCGDGTTRLSGLLPDASATRLATYLEAFTNPRTTRQQVDQAPRKPDFARLPYPRRLGQAFCHLLETLDPHRLPLHGGDATTVVVTISLDALRAELGTGQLLTGAHLPGEDPATGALTAAEVRRLACTAQLIPAVLGGDSVPLDLGRSRRLYTRHQRIALLLRDRVCRAEGCDIPGTWAEAHHLHPWSHGGPTDLADGVLLCRHHHQRAHDPHYTTHRLPNGDIRYRRRP